MLIISIADYVLTAAEFDAEDEDMVLDRVCQTITAARIYARNPQAFETKEQTK